MSLLAGRNVKIAPLPDNTPFFTHEKAGAVPPNKVDSDNETIVPLQTVSPGEAEIVTTGFAEVFTVMVSDL